jgi:hypothetical protein
MHPTPTGSAMEMYASIHTMAMRTVVAAEMRYRFGTDDTDINLQTAIRIKQSIFALIHHRSCKPGQNPDVDFMRRIQLANGNNWRRLIQEFQNHVDLFVRRNGGAANSSEPSEEQRTQQLIDLILNDQISKAVQLMTTGIGFVKIDSEDKLEKIKKLFPTGGGTGESIEAVLAEVIRDMPPLIQLSGKAVSAALGKLKFKKGVGPNEVTDSKCLPCVFRFQPHHTHNSGASQLSFVPELARHHRFLHI